MQIEKIIKIIELQIGQRGITKNQRLLEDLKLESFDLVNIISKIETKYQIILPQEDIASLRTVEDIYLTVQKAK